MKIHKKDFFKSFFSKQKSKNLFEKLKGCCEKGSVFFNRSNVLIVFLIVVFVLFALFLYKKTRRQDFVDDNKGVEFQLSEIEELKKEANYTPPTEEEILKQIEELAELRKNAGID